MAEPPRNKVLNSVENPFGDFCVDIFVRPDGTVIVPIANANETAIGAFNSTNGGASWSAVTTIATIRHHTVAGSLREGPLPSAEIDGTGTVYVAWADCRFRRASPRSIRCRDG